MHSLKAWRFGTSVCFSWKQTVVGKAFGVGSDGSSRPPPPLSDEATNGRRGSSLVLVQMGGSGTACKDRG